MTLSEFLNASKETIVERIKAAMPMSSPLPTYWYGDYDSYVDEVYESLKNTPESQIPAEEIVVCALMREAIGDNNILAIVDYNIPFIIDHFRRVTFYKADNVAITTHHIWVTENTAEAIKNIFDFTTPLEVKKAIVECLPERALDINDETTSKETLDYLGSLGLIKSSNIFKEAVRTEDTSDTDHVSRFSSAVWFEEVNKTSIVLAGLGGIGSYVALLLSRLHPYKLFLYDDDFVEHGNISGQLYSTNQVGRRKVDASLYNIIDFCQYYPIGVYSRFNYNTAACPVMICGFDNMSSRKQFFEKWYDVLTADSVENRENYILIDGRLAAEEFQVFCAKGNDINSIQAYRESLFDDSEAEHTQCSYKQTSFMANMIGSVMVNCFVNFITNKVMGFPYRDLPNKITYNGSTLQFTVQ